MKARMRVCCCKLNPIGNRQKYFPSLCKTVFFFPQNGSITRTVAKRRDFERLQLNLTKTSCLLAGRCSLTAGCALAFAGAKSLCSDDPIVIRKLAPSRSIFLLQDRFVLFSSWGRALRFIASTRIVVNMFKTLKDLLHSTGTGGHCPRRERKVFCS